MKHKIRLNKTNSIHSVNKENQIDVNLTNTSKIVKYNNIRETVDSYEVYKKERSLSNRYRLILTVNPFCSNVLFNPLTEIAKYTKVNDGEKIERVLDSVTINGVNGGGTSKRVQFIADTTYSNEENGYIYYPGYDIFDNHILRSRDFSVICATNNKSGRTVSQFNTLADYARNSEGDIIKIMKRTGGINVRPSEVNKHVYNYDTLMTYDDSLHYNISEQDGWIGFPNSTKLKTYYRIPKNTRTDKSTNWNRVLNNYSATEFVQMYPDRTLYSFTPNYNKILNRLEYNWDIVITYPYENDYSNDLVNFKGMNALKLYSARIQKGLSGEDVIVFRSFVKHNLKRNDNVCLMWGDKTESEVYRVTNVGNLDGNNEEYYFYIDDPSLVTEFGNITNENNVFYFQKIVNGIPSKYYLRKFKKLNYDGKILAKEQYDLGFATTIYNDGITQITFTDNLDFSGLTDNLGRPVCEFYITILKTNKGNKEWYKNNNTIISGEDAKKIEYSHCFTKLTDGLDMHFEMGDFSEDEDRQINNFNIRFIGGNSHKWLSENDKDVDEELGITKDQETFYGDVVEFIPNEYKEYVIAKVNYRFNTYQRENPRVINKSSDDSEAAILTYHNIVSDDYDFQENFKIEENVINQFPRNEGYFYIPHYPIRMKEEGAVIQGSHYTIRLRNIDVIQSEDVRIKIVSMQTSNVNNGDIVLLMDDKNGFMFDFRVVYVETSTVFYISPVNGWFGRDGFIENSNSKYKTSLTWNDIAELLRRGEDMFIRRRNSDIPSYAALVDKNTFLWREYYNNGVLTDSQLPEYIFTNNAFYVTPVINFYVKRQDPNGYFGLYKPEEQNPQDIAGETKKASNYSYNDPETKATC